jgi:DNA-binding PucR family transcriptional regulator
MDAATTPARERSQEVHHCIIDDIHETPFAKQASHNLTAAAVLIRDGSKLTTLEEKKLRQHLQMILDAAAVPQVESSASLLGDSKSRLSHVKSRDCSSQPGVIQKAQFRNPSSH